eukprot:1407510-Amphidinium_carterae.1
MTLNPAEPKDQHDMVSTQSHTGDQKQNRGFSQQTFLPKPPPIGFCKHGGVMRHCPEVPKLATSSMPIPNVHRKRTEPSPQDSSQNFLNVCRAIG